MFVFNLLSESLQFGFCARDKDEVESFLGELERKLFAQAVRSSGYDGPRAFLAVFAEL
jgi:hypothetical protein